MIETDDPYGVPPAGEPVAPPRPRRRPVLSFVAVVVLLAVALVGLQATGAATPWLETETIGSSSEPGFEVTQVAITNRGLLPVRVDAVTWAGSDLADAQVTLLPAGAAPDPIGPTPRPGPHAGEPTHGTAMGPFTLKRGETRVAVVRGRPTCPSGPSFGSVQIAVRSWLGRHRTVPAGASSSDGPGLC